MIARSYTNAENRRQLALAMATLWQEKESAPITRWMTARSRLPTIGERLQRFARASATASPQLPLGIVTLRAGALGDARL